jgi:hypothetical protein
MKVVAGEDGGIEEENDPCQRQSTVRFADVNVGIEEEKVEEIADIIP